LSPETRTDDPIIDLAMMLNPTTEHSNKPQQIELDTHGLWERLLRHVFGPRNDYINDFITEIKNKINPNEILKQLEGRVRRQAGGGGGGEATDILDIVKQVKENYRVLVREVTGRNVGRNIRELVKKAEPLLDTCYSREKSKKLDERLSDVLSRASNDDTKKKLGVLIVALALAELEGMLSRERAEWAYELLRSALGLPHCLWAGDVAMLFYLINEKIGIVAGNDGKIGLETLAQLIGYLAGLPEPSRTGSGGGSS